jgi:two-component system chemotaxis sensor kinase CheA
MDKDRLIERLMRTFLEELDEHVAALEQNALALERASEGRDRGELVQTLFRTVHSLKGAARSVEVRRIERVCHRLETQLSPLRDGAVEPSEGLVELLLEAGDALGDAGRRLRAGVSLDGSPLDALHARLEGRQAAPSQAAPPPATPLESPEEISVTAGREPAAEAEPAAPAPKTVRVGTEKLDTLLTRSGELLVAGRAVETHGAAAVALRDGIARLRAQWRRVERSAVAKAARDHAAAGAAGGQSRKAVARFQELLDQLEREADRLVQGSRATSRALVGAIASLDDEARRVRLLPFGEACGHLDRAARDVAAALGKRVEVEIAGADVEIDRAILERVRDPLLHIVRNAVDHGIERPETRVAAGKPPHGTVVVEARLSGSQVEIRVSDDGRGLDVAAIRARAEAMGVTVAEDGDAAALIFQPGFSTSEAVTELSGRGVGLDVVVAQIEALHGSVEVTAAAGRGTTFALTLPLTLTTIRAVLVSAAGQPYAIPTTSVRSLVRVDEQLLSTIDGRDHIAFEDAGREEMIPVVDTGALLGAGGAPGNQHGVAIAVLAASGRRVGFAVDALLAEQEVVVKPLGRRVRLRLFSGATVLADGRLALILNVAELVRIAVARAPRARPALAATQPSRAKKRIVVVDDSVTTRTLERSILEAAGYEVATAADGAEAWALLEQSGADLVVSDVEMPRMDGFGLTARIRASARFRTLPVVLLTALESERDRIRGVEAGASAYLGKSAFDQSQLLDVIGQLI